MIVLEMKNDGVTVRFHDDYCKEMDEERVRQTLRRMADRAMIDLNDRARAENRPDFR